MTLTPMTIAPFRTGLDTDQEPWLLPPDSFTEIDNIHVKHGFIERRSGFNPFGNLVPNAATVVINNITQANPGLVTTAAAHGLTTGDFVYITGVLGMTEVNFKIFTVTVPPTSVNTFTIGLNTTNFTAYAGAGTMALIAPAVDRVMGITRFVKSDGTYELLAFNTTRASVYNGLTNSFDQLDAADIMSGDEYDYIWAENWQSSGVVNRLYFTNGKVYDGASVDGIRYYDGVGGVTNLFIPELDSTPGDRILYGGQLLFVIKERLVVLNTYEFSLAGGTTSQFPQRARWCQAQGPSNWNDITPGGGGFVDAPTGEQIISARALQDIIIVIFTNSVWTLRPVGDPALPFRWDKINDFRACDGKMATVGYDRDVRALGVRGITATDGVETRRIDNRIEFFTVNDINVGQFRKVYCQRSYTNRRWWTLYCGNVEGSETENDKALIWDDESSAYSTYTISMNCLGYGNAGFDYGLNDFTAANGFDWCLVSDPENDDCLDGPAEETLQNFFFQDNQEIFLGGNINGQIFILENTDKDASEPIDSTFTTAAWNPFKEQGLAAKLVYIDIFVDTDTYTSGVIEFFKDNSTASYAFQALDFMPNLNYISSIIDIDLTNPVNINTASHGLSTGDVVYIYSVVGTVQVNDGPYIITVVDQNNFTLDGVDGTGFTAHVIGGKVYKRQFYKRKEWKRVMVGGTGYEHTIKFTSAISTGPFKIHGFRPYFKPAGRTVN